MKPSPAATAINEFGVQLHRRLAAAAPAENLCVSPYSIQSALAMTFAGADGETREEMARTLHYRDGDEIHGEMSVLSEALQAIVRESQDAAGEIQQFAADRRAKLLRLLENKRITQEDFDAMIDQYGGEMERVIVLTIANRLFGKKGCTFREPFLDILSHTYKAPLDVVDFEKDPAAAVAHINSWVESQTCQRIRDLIPPGGINLDTELVLVNALYLKASWKQVFIERVTRPAPFHTMDGGSKEVPTMGQTECHGYAQREGFQAITLDYVQRGLHFLILLPDNPQGLPELERKLTAGLLSDQAELPTAELLLYLPKFKIEPGTLALASELQAMGMKRAFDASQADFGRMATRPPGEGLVISEIFHKTFIAVEEKGTEAAAATAVLMFGGGYINKPEPIEVKVDRPFLFAIQHRDSGACLFLGRVTNP